MELPALNYSNVIQELEIREEDMVTLEYPSLKEHHLKTPGLHMLATRTWFKGIGFKLMDELEQGYKEYIGLLERLSEGNWNKPFQMTQQIAKKLLELELHALEKGINKLVTPLELWVAEVSRGFIPTLFKFDRGKKGPFSWYAAMSEARAKILGEDQLRVASYSEAAEQCSRRSSPGVTPVGGYKRDYTPMYEWPVWPKVSDFIKGSWYRVVEPTSPWSQLWESNWNGWISAIAKHPDPLLGGLIFPMTSNFILMGIRVEVGRRRRQISGTSLPVQVEQKRFTIDAQTQVRASEFTYQMSPRGLGGKIAELADRGLKYWVMTDYDNYGEYSSKDLWWLGCHLFSTLLPEEWRSYFLHYVWNVYLKPRYCFPTPLVKRLVNTPRSYDLKDSKELIKAWRDTKTNFPREDWTTLTAFPPPEQGGVTGQEIHNVVGHLCNQIVIEKSVELMKKDYPDARQHSLVNVDDTAIVFDKELHARKFPAYHKAICERAGLGVNVSKAEYLEGAAIIGQKIWPPGRNEVNYNPIAIGGRIILKSMWYERPPVGYGSKLARRVERMALTSRMASMHVTQSPLWYTLRKKLVHLLEETAIPPTEEEYRILESLHMTWESLINSTKMVIQRNDLLMGRYQLLSQRFRWKPSENLGDFKELFKYREERDK